MPKHSPLSRVSLLVEGAMRERLQARLRALTVLAGVTDELHHAAVAVVVLEEGDGAQLSGIDAPTDWSRDAALLLTRRAASLRRTRR